MSITIPISRKIWVVGISTAIVAIGELANQVTGLYPHNTLVNILPFVLPPVLGWLKKEEVAEEDISSQIEVEPTPVEWAQPTAPASPVVAETIVPAPVSTPVALPNADVPVATPIVPDPSSNPVLTQPVTPPAGIADSTPYIVKITPAPTAFVDPKTGLVTNV